MKLHPDNFREFLVKNKKLIDVTLDKFLKLDSEFPEIIHKAVRYAVFDGGKRIRPLLTVATAQACGCNPKNIILTGCAIELIHNYSLIHDDLPSMDNDDYRRGKLTVHRKFGESIAILAGDALLTKAFELIVENSRVKGISQESILEVIKIISDAAGIKGMIGGQVMDILVNSKKRVHKHDKFLLDNIYRKKTSRLIEASVISAAYLADVGKRERKALRNYAQKIGLAFQIVDDILDSDKNKVTYPVVYGIEKSKKKTINLISEAKKELGIFGSKAYRLGQLADYIISRTH